MKRIFISYKRSDLKIVSKIQQQIEAALQMKCWIDLEGIESDAVFASKIIKGINDCEIFLFMYSQNHTKIIDYGRDWTIRELTFAEEKKKRIVFVNLDKSELTDWFQLLFNVKQQVDGTSAVALGRFINDLKKWLGLTQDISSDNDEDSYEIGERYYYGEGVAQDYAEAVKWYRKAAEQGDASAQYSLGYCYCNGEGVVQDYSEAVKWFRKAAEQGNANAQLGLGCCYDNGYGVSQDYAEAVKWYRKAAEQGDASAQNSLGLCYDKGYGVAQDYAEAVKWYRKAAEQGDVSAQYNLGCCYYKGEGVSQDYAEAVKWYRKAAEQGDKKGQFELGWCYYYSKGVPKDKEKAREYFQLSANQGYELADTLLRTIDIDELDNYDWSKMFRVE